MTLPPRVLAEAERILDGAARRLLAEQMDRDASGTAAGTDNGTVDGRADQCAPLTEAQPIPIGRRVDSDSRGLAA